jgi:hypothetical protein
VSLRLIADVRISQISVSVVPGMNSTSKKTTRREPRLCRPESRFGGIALESWTIERRDFRLWEHKRLSGGDCGIPLRRDSGHLCTLASLYLKVSTSSAKAAVGCLRLG